MLFFAETFQPMNAAVTFQIGLNESARAIRGKFTFAGAWESWCRMRTNSNTHTLSVARGVIPGNPRRNYLWPFERSASDAVKCLNGQIKA